MPCADTSQVLRAILPNWSAAIMFNPAHRDPSNGLYLFTVLPDSDNAAVPITPPPRLGAPFPAGASRRPRAGRPAEIGRGACHLCSAASFRLL
jgi:hypothetical protein